MSGLSILFFFGCENLTEQEFKQKYDWDETICTVGSSVGNLGSGLKDIKFVYSQEEYRVTGGGFPGIETGYQYHILFDKNAPEKHYLVLYHKPVKPKKIEDFSMIGKIKKVYKSDTKKNSRWKIFLYVEYQCYSFGDNKWFKYEEAIPLEYYDALNQIKENQDDVIVDCYIIKEYGDGRGAIRTFLNLENLKPK